MRVSRRSMVSCTQPAPATSTGKPPGMAALTILPIFPSAIHCDSSGRNGISQYAVAHPKAVPLSRQTRTISSATESSTAMGFSHETALTPACAQAMTAAGA